MAGIPPLTGFLGKLYIFEAAVSENLYFLAIVAVLTSVIAAAYYLWIIKVMLMDEPDMAQWADHYRTYRREPAHDDCAPWNSCGIIVDLYGAKPCC